MRLFRIAAITITVLLILGTVPIAAEEEAEEKGTTLRVFYDKGFRLGSPKDAFSLRINGLLQVRYSSVDYDPTTRFNDREYSNFYVRRARLYFSGHAADSRFTYLLHIQLEPNQGLNANDMWLEYQFSDLLRLGAGRNKISYGLEFMNSGSALGMIDRSVMYGETDIDLGAANEPGPRYPGGGTARFGLSWQTDTGFSVGGLTPYRSLGVQLRGHKGSASSSTIEYQVGIWQGNATRSLSNSGSAHLYSLRVGYHPWGFVDWKIVGDIDHSENFKLGLLASAYANSDDKAGGYDERAHNLAAMLRYRGWSVDIEWGAESFDYDLFADDFNRQGARAAIGWFVVPRKVELRGRYAEITRLEDPTYAKATDSGLRVAEVWGGDDWIPALEAKISEMSLAASYRIRGWRNVLALDFSRLVREFAADPTAVIDGVPAPIEKAPSQVDYRIRAMVQLVF